MVLTVTLFVLSVPQIIGFLVFSGNSGLLRSQYEDLPPGRHLFVKLEQADIYQLMQNCADRFSVFD